ncbi:ribonuclease III [Algicella marina]|uniref:Ribonuclease 3 n=1 Tax=Algicella marina TaxID=2683284 RepID=A0A6P1T718_9RHOB|nr:ribonuclease III [Algicella marina]QHQ37079.1 ribonuclease III [Algicella marina]
MKLNPAQERFSKNIGLTFRNPDLLLEALTHASLSGAPQRDNQRLEFLGDRVLGLVIAEVLLQQAPEANEGELAPRFNALVRKETCADVAVQIDLGSALMMGRSEQASGGRRKTALLGDAMEALIAAVYEDKGFEAARAFVLDLWGDRVAAVDENSQDAKTALQEWAQARGMTPPAYIEMSREGPDHAPVFEISVELENGANAIGRAGSKRAAQQSAAAALLTALTGE